MYENFIRAIEAKGITPPAEIIADGEIHRFDSDHSGKSNGAYVLHSDEPQSGWFKCWKTGTENNWSRGYSETDPVKKEQFQKLIKQRTQERTVKILELQKNAAIKASTEYQDAKPADPDHPYLKRKQIKPVKGLKQDPTTGDLIVPIYCKNGNIISRQTINKEGDKYFLKDGQTKGGYFDFGETTENIVICEGFATGASIFEATGYRVRCGFNCGNLKEVAIISRDEYPKAHIIIAGDDDHNTKGNPGRIKAIEAASSIDTSVVFPDFGENRPEKATDFNDLHCLNGLDAVRKCFETIPEPLQISLADTGLEERQKRKINKWLTPKEIKAELLPVDKLKPKLIPEPLRDWLEDIAHRMQVPLDFSASACVVMLSSIIGTRLSIRPKKSDSWRVIPNLWGSLIQRPSQLKSPPVQEVFRVLDKLEAESFKQNEDAEKIYQNENRKFEMKQKIYEDNLRKAMKKGDEYEVGSAENELEILESEPPEKPTTRRYQTQDATPEKLQDLLSENPQGILVFRDELNGFLMSLEKEGHETARAFYLEGWNGGGSFTLDRITRGTVRSNLICISLFGTTQPAKIIPHIRKAKSETGNDGMLQRFQIAVYPEAVKWNYIDKTPNLSAHSRALKLIRRLTEMDFREHDSVMSESDGIPYMKFSAEAQELFESWIKDLETNKLNNLDESPSLLEHFGKYRSLMPSLALIFHFLGIADSKRSDNVSLQAAQQAAQWCEYLEKHARRIYGMAEDITARAAGSLSKKIKNGILKDDFTAREVHRKGWELLTEIETVNAALTDLVEANWLREIPILPTEKGGRKTMNYQINPEIKNLEYSSTPTDKTDKTHLIDSSVSSVSSHTRHI